MKFLLTIFIIVCLASCRTMKPTVTYVTKDSIVTKDTTIYKTVTEVLPGDTVELWQAIPCPEARVDTFVKKGNNSLSVKLLKGFLHIDCRADSLLHVIDSITNLKTKEAYHEKTERVEVPVIVKKWYIPTWVKWLTAINIILLLWRFKNPIGKFFKNILTKIVNAG